MWELLRLPSRTASLPWLGGVHRKLGASAVPGGGVLPACVTVWANGLPQALVRRQGVQRVRYGHGHLGIGNLTIGLAEQRAHQQIPVISVDVDSAKYPVHLGESQWVKNPSCRIRWSHLQDADFSGPFLRLGDSGGTVFPILAAYRIRAGKQGRLRQTASTRPTIPCPGSPRFRGVRARCRPSYDRNHGDGGREVDSDELAGRRGTRCGVDFRVLSGTVAAPQHQLMASRRVTRSRAIPVSPGDASERTLRDVTRPRCSGAGTGRDPANQRSATSTANWE